MTAPPLEVDHPWPGPESFRTEDAAFFRGRDGEIKQVLQRIRRSRSVVLYGASGLGKTSLVNAGVIPRLPADELFAVPIRVGYHAGAPPVAEQIQAEIFRNRSGPGMPATRLHATAWELMHLRDEPIEDAQPLLIFDQFEELFTIGAGTPQAAELIEELRGMIEDVPPASVRRRLERSPEQARSLSFQRKSHRVLLSIREDFLYGLELLRTQLPSIIHHHFRLGPLGGAAALEVVLQPGAAATAASAPAVIAAPLVEPDVAELIVRTVASSVDDDRPLDVLEVEPALLSILSAELARRRAPGAPITRALVTGNRTDIIAAFYERAVHDAPDPVRAYIEDQLVTATGYRTSAVVEEALAVDGFTSEVLAQLVNRRLLRVIDRQKARWIELTHDILTELATRSRRLRQERRRVESELRARTENQHRDQLARAAQYRKRRNVALVILGGLVLTLGLLVSLYQSERRSRWAEADHYRLVSDRYEAEQRARAAANEAKRTLRRPFIEASLREERNQEAMAQLAAVVREQPEAVWARALLGDLLLRRAWPMPAAPWFPDGPFSGLACNKARSRCAAAYRDGTVLVRGDISRQLVTDQKGYGSLWMSDDGEGLVWVPYSPGTALRWTLGAAEPRVVRFPIDDSWRNWWASVDTRIVVVPSRAELLVWRFGEEATVERVARTVSDAEFCLSLDGKWLAYQYDQNTLILADTHGKAIHRFPLAGTPTFVSFDPASKFLFAATGDATLRRWTVPAGAELAPLHPERAVRWIWFDTSGDQMALWLEGGGVALWSGPWRAPHVLMRSSHGVMDLSFAPDRRWLAIAARDGAVSAWSATGSPLSEPVRLDGLAFASTLGGDGLLGVSLAGSSARWTLAAPRARREYDLGEPILNAWFVAEHAVIAYGASRALQVRGDHTTTQPVFRSPLYLSRDLRHAVSSYTESVYLRHELPRLPYKDEADQLLISAKADGAVFSADGTRVAVSGGGEARIFDAATGQMIGAPVTGTVSAVLSDDGSLLATRGNEVGLTLWREAHGGWRQLTRIAELDVFPYAFDHAGTAIVLASENRARVFQLRDQQFTGHAVAHDSRITALAFSPDGRWIATGSEDKRARIWEAASGLPASDWFEHGGSVTAVEFSPSGRALLTGASDGHLRLWDLAGSGDASERDRLWLARLAEILSGMRVDPATGEVVPAPHAYEALVALRADLEGACPAGRGTPDCSSATIRLIRSLVDGGGADRSTPGAP